MKLNLYWESILNIFLVTIKNLPIRPNKCRIYLKRLDTYINHIYRRYICFKNKNVHIWFDLFFYFKYVGTIGI